MCIFSWCRPRGMEHDDPEQRSPDFQEQVFYFYFSRFYLVSCFLKLAATANLLDTPANPGIANQGPVLSTATAHRKAVPHRPRIFAWRGYQLDMGLVTKWLWGLDPTAWFGRIS